MLHLGPSVRSGPLGGEASPVRQPGAAEERLGVRAVERGLCLLLLQLHGAVDTGEVRTGASYGVDQGASSGRRLPYFAAVGRVASRSSPFACQCHGHSQRTRVPAAAAVPQEPPVRGRHVRHRRGVVPPAVGHAARPLPLDPNASDVRPGRFPRVHREAGRQRGLPPEQLCAGVSRDAAGRAQRGRHGRRPLAVEPRAGA